ncbi:MAG: dethiobiotin synthase [Verrucomicrobia bacterium A1]|nr:MAG: dethiobiotin synthase [Verrucomicrobia bacterium A1]
MRSFFITGTDTGVGKTALTATLLAAARKAGIDAIPMKPIQTGVRRIAGLAGDIDVVARAASWHPVPGETQLLCPYRFAPACSPHLAAVRAGEAIRMDRLEGSLRKLLQFHDSVLVEGAGGVSVPIGGRRTMLDLMAAMGLPVLVAARAGLGTLNHTMLTCAAVRKRGVELAGVVMVQSGRGPWTPLMQDNLETLRRFGIPVLGRLPFMPGFARAPRPAVQRVLQDPAVAWTASLLRG